MWHKEYMLVAKQTHNAAFVIGTVLGGAVGAASALWKTPMSGQELREKLGVGDLPIPSLPTTSETTNDAGTRKENKLLSFVEQAAAPIVGVTLGQTANNGGTAPVAAAPNSVSPTKGEDGFTLFPDLKA
jgi:hypothetical protein